MEFIPLNTFIVFSVVTLYVGAMKLAMISGEPFDGFKLKKTYWYCGEEKFKTFNIQKTQQVLRYWYRQVSLFMCFFYVFHWFLFCVYFSSVSLFFMTALVCKFYFNHFSLRLKGIWEKNVFQNNFKQLALKIPTKFWIHIDNCVDTINWIFHINQNFCIEIQYCFRINNKFYSKSGHQKEIFFKWIVFFSKMFIFV